MPSKKYTVGEIVRVIIGATGTAEKYGGQEVTVIQQAEFAGAMVRVKAQDNHTFLLMDDEIGATITKPVKVTIDNEEVQEQDFFPVLTIHGVDYELASYGPPYSDGSRQATLRRLS